MKFVIILLILAAIVFAVMAVVRVKRQNRAVKVADAKQAVQTKRSAGLDYTAPSSQVYGGTYRSKAVPAAKPTAPKPKPYKPTQSRDRDEVYGGGYVDDTYYAGSDEYSRPSYTDPTPSYNPPNYDSGSSTSGGGYSGGGSDYSSGSSSSSDSGGSYSSGSSDY